MHTVAWWPTFAVLTVASFTDLRSRRIPNWLVIPFLLTGVAVSAWLRGWLGLGQSFAGLGMGFLVFGVLFLMGGMGAGDVKLCAAIGAWIGPTQLLTALVLTGIAGGIIALCWAFMGGFVGDMLSGASDFIFGWMNHRTRAHSEEIATSKTIRRKMPYAPAIAIGTLMSFLSLPR